jgi:hypothetical protein
MLTLVLVVFDVFSYELLMYDLSQVLQNHFVIVLRHFSVFKWSTSSPNCFLSFLGHIKTLH